MATIFDTLYSAITFGTSDVFSQIIRIIPFHEYNMVDFKNIVFTILSLFESVVQSDNPEMRITSISSVLSADIKSHIPQYIKEFIEVLVDNSPDNQNFHPIVVILRDNRANNLTTQILYVAGYRGASNIKMLIKQDNDTNCFRAILRSCKIGKLSSGTVEELIELAEGEPNNEAVNALGEYLASIKKRSEKPIWLSTKYGETPKTDDELLAMLNDTEDYVDEFKTNMTPEELAVALTAGLELFNPPPEQLENLQATIFAQVNAMPEDERNSYIDGYLRNVSRQPMVFIEKFNRILGPANTNNVSFTDDGGQFIVDVKTIVYDTDGSWCSETGGHRMLYCNHFEIDEDTNHESGYDWYLGADKSCMKCRNYIPVREWAVRYPLNNGGWMGCFCSWDCVSKTKPIDNGSIYPIKKDDCDDEGCDVKGANQQVLTIAILRMAQLIQEYGIEERRKVKFNYPSFSIAGLTL